METVVNRGKSRKYRRKNSGIKEKRNSHFRTVRFGGLEEGQVLVYLWDIVKALEAERGPEPAQTKTVEKQIRKRVRVEIRRYFARHKHRNMKILLGTLCTALCMSWLFLGVIGIDRVAGTSMYPYLNDGDWIVYSRIVRELRRADVVVFQKNHEVLVKRLAGMPGDCVEINDTGSRIVVNGEPVREDYITLTQPEDVESRASFGVPQTVMNGQYLVLGDNCAVSVDSRDSHIGTVPAEDVLGRVFLIIRMGS